MHNNRNPDAIRRLVKERIKQSEIPLKDSPTLGMILSVSGSDEQMSVSSSPSRVTIVHPFMSMTSWDRAIPEAGSTVFVKYNKDVNEPVMTNYRLLTPKESIDNYNSGTGLYMELAPGEFQRLSSGLAYTYHSNKMAKESFAGLVGYTLDGESNTYLEKAPTFVKLLHQHEVGTIKDTYRLGVVRRPVTSVTTKIVKDVLNNCFAKEHTLILVNKKGVLLDYREGNVVSDLGTFDICSATGNQLRSSKKVYTSSSNYTLKEIDNLGNIFIKTSKDAVSGLNLDVTSGRFVGSIGKDLSLTVTNDISVLGNSDISLTSKKSVKIDGSTNIDITAKNINTLDGITINLGKKATHPLLHGDTFLTSLLEFLVSTSAHTHPGGAASLEYAAAVLAIQTSLVNVLSKKTLTE